MIFPFKARDGVEGVNGWRGEAETIHLRRICVANIFLRCPNIVRVEQMWEQRFYCDVRTQ
ncbi:hypothetical protein BBI15_16285 [Planococcus plakortidis]|uniref:Uncharacterized protein n=1 Tax=Planococcus plakortidis TaxID=1038856 RepID=A0A1I9W9N5_9BACL|nr:hypothetical protein BBI15_16285 [Planococcus plakortidis]